MVATNLQTRLFLAPSISEERPYPKPLDFSSSSCVHSELNETFYPDYSRVSLGGAYDVKFDEQIQGLSFCCHSNQGLCATEYYGTMRTKGYKISLDVSLETETNKV